MYIYLFISKLYLYKKKKIEYNICEEKNGELLIKFG